MFGHSILLVNHLIIKQNAILFCLKETLLQQKEYISLHVSALISYANFSNPQAQAQEEEWQQSFTLDRL